MNQRGPLKIRKPQLAQAVTTTVPQSDSQRNDNFRSYFPNSALSLMTVSLHQLIFSQPNRWDRLPWWLSGKEPACQFRRCGFNPGSGRSLQKERATHSGILAWKIPRTEEPGRLQPTGSQRVGHDLVTKGTATDCDAQFLRTFFILCFINLSSSFTSSFQHLGRFNPPIHHILCELKETQST